MRETSTSKAQRRLRPPPQRPAVKPSAKRRGLAFDGFCTWDGDTLVLNVVGTPGASRDAIGKPKGNQLPISVTEAPVAGRATDHMVWLLADRFGVGVADIEVVFGRFNINKQLRIRAPKTLPAVVAKHLRLGTP